MRIFVTGGSGFVGRAVCLELIKRGHHLSCLVRPGSESRLIASAQLQPVKGDLFSSQELTPLIKGSDAVIHLVGIIREFPSDQITFDRLHHTATTAVVAAACSAGVKRYLHMSANGTRIDAQTGYHQTKWLAEERVRNSDLDWTIFRPSLIYGREDQFINMLAALIRKLPIVPVMGDGEYRMQPVSVVQIAEGFAAALEATTSSGKTYYCGGRDCLSYNQLLDVVGSALGKKRLRKIHQPLALMRPMVALLQHLSIFPMTSDQLEMLLEGNCCDPGEWVEDLDLSLASLPAGLDYLKTR